MTFARFMQLALHHPEHGYYARGPERLGREGDFFTAADVGPAFGRCLARQLVEMDRILGMPETLRYVEHGAGRGHLAKDVLDALAAEAPEVASRVAPALIDSSPGMRAEAGARVPAASVSTPGEEATGGAGCVVAMELLDALPVHRVRRRAGELREVMVALDGEKLVEVEGQAENDVLAWAAEHGAAPEDGDETEVCLALTPAVARLAGSIDRGFVVIVDYGHEAERLYGPAHRRGTLLAYHRHRASEEYLERVGEQDLTAHVNLTALTSAAARLGLDALGTVTQSAFLVGNGILEDLDADEPGSLAAIRRRLQAKQLIHPLGMGATFKVAIFAKGLPPVPTLRGLTAPA